MSEHVDTTDVVETDTTKTNQAITFTQAQVDEIVQARLARAKVKYEDEIKTKLETLAPKAELAEKSEAALKEILTDIESELDSEKLTDLLPEGLDTLGRLNYIRKNKKHLLKEGDTSIQATQTVTTEEKPKPKIPESNKPKVTPEVKEFGNGKYATIGEYAKNDPVGYRAWAKTQK